MNTILAMKLLTFMCIKGIASFKLQKRYLMWKDFCFDIKKALLFL